MEIMRIITVASESVIAVGARATTNKEKVSKLHVQFFKLIGFRLGCGNPLLH
jgi:hypothetical protein